MSKKITSSPNYFVKRLSLFADPIESSRLIESIDQVFDSYTNNFFVEEINEKLEQDEKINIPEKQNSSGNEAELLDNSEIDNRNKQSSSSLICITCKCTFADREEQISHFKGDLHTFNLKQKLKGKPVCTADEFENLTDISSISGNSDNDDDGNETSSSSSSDSDATKVSNKKQASKNKPKLTYRLNDSNFLQIFRCVLHGKKNLPESDKEYLSLIKSIKKDDFWCVILIAAGHFAAAVFKGEEPILHKTFHRYVVRAKRGTVQSQHDCCSGRFAKSAGANIRREQESAFKDDVKTLLASEWKSELEKCKCIFIRVPSYNRALLFSEKQQHSNLSLKSPFNKHDTRIRHIPFMTFRPTFKEVKRVHNILSRIEIYNSDYLNNFLENFEKKNVNKSPNKDKTVHNTSKLNVAIESNENINCNVSVEEEEENESNENFDYQSESADKFEASQSQSQIDIDTKECDFIQNLEADNLNLFNDIYTFCLTDNSKKLEEKFNEILLGKSTTTNSDGSLKMELDTEKKIMLENLLNKRINKENGFTLLHLTSELGYHECVWQLLLHGADPTIYDLTRQKRFPYSIASNKKSRDQYRLYMNDYPDRYNYKLAKVPSPLDRSKLNEKSDKEKEKRKEKRKLKKDRLSQLDKQQQTKEMESEERKRFLALTDNEKRELLIDRNFLNLLPNNFANTNNNADNNNQNKSNATSLNEKFSDLKVISRCWYCGHDMSTFQPFEYFDYKFCSTKCLKSHRSGNNQTAGKSSSSK